MKHFLGLFKLVGGEKLKVADVSLCGESEQIDSFLIESSYPGIFTYENNPIQILQLKCAAGRHKKIPTY